MLSRRISTNLIANIHETFLKCQPKMQQQICLIHHHKELEQPGGHLRFIGVQRSNRHKANRNTHVNERKFAKLRGRKTFLIRLDDHEERREMDKLPPDQLRLYMLRKGKPNMFANIEPRKWEEHQITYQSCWTIIEPYVPPEKSLITRIGKDKTAVLGDIKDLLRTKWTSIGHGEKRIRKKQGLEKFSSAEFPKEAEQIMISTYQALANRDKRKLLGLVTEMMFTKLWPQVEEGTLRWEFVRFTEPSRVIGVRVVDMPLKSGNDIAQVTVRFKYMQKGAYYDRFGHLFLGSEDEEKEVIEYVVFENHIASESGKWRFHARVYPDSSKPKQAIDRPSLIEEDKANRKAPLEPQKLRPGVDQYLKTRKEAEENVPLICLPKSTYFCTKFSPLPKSTYFCTKFSPLPKSTCFCTKLGGNLNFHIYFLFSLLKSNMH